MSVAPDDQPSLERVIGVRALAANTINLTVGAGIFVLPALVAARLGPSAIFAYFVCAFAMGLVLLCFAEAGSRVHESGGACAYAEAAFGPMAGFLVSTLLWFGWGVMGDAFVAVALVGTVGTIWPFVMEPIPRTILLLLLFVVLAAINIRGARHGARMVEILTLAKLVPLLALVCVGTFFVRLDNLRLDGVPTAGEFGAATLVLFFAFAGSESAVTPSGEIRDPARTIPRGLLLGILGIASLFIAIQIVAQGVLGASLPEHSAAPLAATAERLIGPSGIVILLAAAAISMLGALGGDLLATPRALLGSARDGILPRRLASIHPRFHTPFLAIGLYAALGFVLAASGVYETLAILSSMAILLVYLATAAATIELRRRDVRATPAVFRLIGGPLIPLVAAAVIVWLLSQARREEWLSIAVLVAVAAAVYALRRTSRRLGRQPD